MSERAQKKMFRILPMGLVVFLILSTALGMFGGLATQNAKAIAGEGSATIQIGTGGAHAAAAAYGDVSLPGGAGTISVGRLSYVRVRLTVGALGIAANQNNITLQVNPNLFPAGTWDTAQEASDPDLNAVGEWTLFYQDNGGANPAPSLAASAATTAGLITIQGNGIMDADDVIVITMAVQDVSHALASAELVISTDDTGADDLTALGDQVDIITAAADAAASVVQASPLVGATGSTTLTLTLPIALANTDTVDITFPAHMDVSDVSFATHSLGGVGIFVCAAAGQVVTCTADDTISAGTGNIVMNGITSLYAATTDVTSVQVEALGEAADDIATDSSVALTDITANALASTNVQPATTTVSQTVNNTVTFTTVNPIPSTGLIRITYPAGFDVSGAASATCSSMDGAFATGVAAQVVTITRSGGSEEAAGAQTCTISGIKNPTSAGSAGTYTITTLTGAAANLDTDAAVSADSFFAASSGGGGGGSTTTPEPEEENTGEVTEGEATAYTVDTSRTISVNGETHTVTVTYADALSVTLTIESDPIEVTVAKGSYEDVDTDSDGINDVRVQYEGFDSNGDPQLIISSIEAEGSADTSTTCEMPSGMGTSPLTGDAEAITDVVPGNYIKSDNYSTVYYVTSDCERRVFMDEKSFFTWQDSFDSIVTVTDATLSELSLAGIMLPKAGVVLVKIQSDPKVYVLDNGTSVYSPILRWLADEDVAIDLFGSDWADYVIDVEPTFFSKFTQGGFDVESTSDYDGDSSMMKKRTALKS